VIEVVIALSSGILLCVIAFWAGHLHGHKCERTQAMKAMRAMRAEITRAMERELSSHPWRVSPWN